MRNIYSPWPEEINRRLTASIARYHFAPTESARQDLLREGVTDKNICVTENTVIDTLLSIIKRLDKDSSLMFQLDSQFDFLDRNRRILLVTGHRRENFGGGFESICLALKHLAERGDIEILYPVHLNPCVSDTVFRMLGGCPRIHLIEPLDYVPFVYLMRRSFLVLTDSGGVQEEAPALGKPVLVMRNTTERPEAVAAGTARLVGTDALTIIRRVEQLLDSEDEYQLMAQAHNPYGDGRVSERIIDWLLNK